MYADDCKRGYVIGGTEVFASLLSTLLQLGLLLATVNVCLSVKLFMRAGELLWVEQKVGSERRWMQRREGED